MNQLTRNKEKQKSHYVFFPSDELFITRVSSEKNEMRMKEKKDKKIKSSISEKNGRVTVLANLRFGNWLPTRIS